MTTLYIAGPMTGIPEYNYPAFNTAAAKLQARGFTVLNPTLGNTTPNNDPPGMTWAHYLRRALAMVVKADGIALLPGWTDSRGAQLEAHVAEALGMPLWGVDQWIKP